MEIVHENSLFLTLDSLNEVLFFDKPLSPSEKEQIALWLAGRQGKPGSYAGMFAPTLFDYDNGVWLFTGEKIPSKGAVRHILGEETCRALHKLDVDHPEVREALDHATEGMMHRLTEYFTSSTGYY